MQMADTTAANPVKDHSPMRWMTNGQLRDGEGDNAEQEADGILGQEDGVSAIADANVSCREAATGKTHALSCQFRTENQQGRLTIDNAISVLPRINILAVTMSIVSPVNAYRTPRVLGPRFSSSKSAILSARNRHGYQQVLMKTNLYPPVFQMCDPTGPGTESMNALLHCRRTWKKQNAITHQSPMTGHFSRICTAALALFRNPGLCLGFYPQPMDLK